MEIKIIDRQEKILLSREEIKAKVIFTDAVPSEADIKKALASQIKGNDKLIKLKIFPRFKNNSADIFAYHYISEQEMAKAEPKKAEKADKKKEQAKTEEGK